MRLCKGPCGCAYRHSSGDSTGRHSEAHHARTYYASTCSPAKTVYVQAPAAPAPAAPGPAYRNYPAGAFTDSQSLYDSLANEQQTELQAAPAYDYYSPGNITVHVYCTPNLGLFTRLYLHRQRPDGDTGYGDSVTVIDNGNAWSDTGMNWTGPDIYIEWWRHQLLDDSGSVGQSPDHWLSRPERGTAANGSDIIWPSKVGGMKWLTSALHRKLLHRKLH